MSDDEFTAHKTKRTKTSYVLRLMNPLNLFKGVAKPLAEINNDLGLTAAQKIPALETNNIAADERYRNLATKYGEDILARTAKMHGALSWIFGTFLMYCMGYSFLAFKNATVENFGVVFGFSAAITAFIIFWLLLQSRHLVWIQANKSSIQFGFFLKNLSLWFKAKG